jgi:hypothetical protein
MSDLRKVKPGLPVEDMVFAQEVPLQEASPSALDVAMPSARDIVLAQGVSEVVKGAVAEFMIEKGLKSPAKINNGFCGDFAEVLLHLLGAVEGLEVQWCSSDDLVYPDDGLFSTFLESLDLHGQAPSVIRRFCEKADGNEMDSILPVHHWISVNGRHFDAETPGGVSSMWELPLYKRLATRLSEKEVLGGVPSENFNSSNWREREAAYGALGGHFTRQHLELLEKGVQDPEPLVKIRALKVAGKTAKGPFAVEGCRLVVSRTHDPDADVRKTVAEVLPEFDSKLAFQSLSHMLTDGDRDVAFAATVSMGKLKCTDSLAVLAFQACDKTPEAWRKRCAAAKGLGLRREESATAFLAQMRNDGDSGVREMVVQSLGKHLLKAGPIREINIAQVLCEFAKDQDHGCCLGVAKTAEHMLKKQGKCPDRLLEGLSILKARTLDPEDGIFGFKTLMACLDRLGIK